MSVPPKHATVLLLALACLGPRAPARSPVSFDPARHPAVTASDASPLIYTKITDEQQRSGAVLLGGMAMVTCGTERPAGNWKLPELISQEPQYGFLSIAGSKRLLVFDKTRAEDKFVTRVFFDANGNGDLTDEEPIPSGLEGKVAVAGFAGFFVSKPIDLTVTIDGQQMPYCLQLTAYPSVIAGTTADGEENQEIAPSEIVEQIMCYARSLCCYTSNLHVGDSTYHLVLVDQDVNGRFDDRATRAVTTADAVIQVPQPRGDRFALSMNERIDYNSYSLLGKHVSIDGNLYELKIDVPAKSVALEPVTDDLADVGLFFYVERLLLENTSTGEFLAALFPGASIQVPRGTWRLSSYTTNKRDAEGDLWRLTAQASAATEAIEVTPGQACQLDFGGPYAPDVTISKQGRRLFQKKITKSVPLAFAIRGVAGETVTGLNHVSGNNTKIPLDKTRSRPAEPTYRIIDQRGEVVASGAFKYG